MAATGPLQLQALGLRLKALGAAGNIGAAQGLDAGFGAGKTLRAQLLAGIRTAAKPLVEDARQAARDKLPKHGGLNERVATSEMRVATRLSGPRVGVRITNRSKGGKGTNRGEISHPVFAKGTDRTKWHWVDPPQPYPAAEGWFDKTLEAKAPEVTEKVVAAMEVVAAEVRGRL